MEFRSQEQEEIYSPTPIQQTAFGRPLSSSPTTLLHAHRGTCDTRNGMGSSLIQKPTPISAAPAVGAVVGGAWPTSTVAAAEADEGTFGYRECLRNHAASIGGHVLDGCCEFMPCADAALKCAACGCHRSFHRKDVGATTSHPLQLLLPPPPTPHHRHGPRPLASSGVLLHAGNCAGVAESSSEEMMLGAPPRQLVVSKKRFRSKFTAEQKERMQAFAERLGWRMQKQEDGALERFCSDVGISRQVFKVWMHNNKSSLRKQQPQQQEEEDEEEEEEQQQQPLEIPEE